MHRIALLLLIVGAMAVSPGGFANPENGETFNDWRAGCSTPQGGDTEVCHVFQNLLVEESGRQLLHAMVVYTGKHVDPVLIVTLPLGVLLPRDMRIRVDGVVRSEKMIFETCTAVGCRAGLLLNAERLAMFQGGVRATVSFYNLEGKRLNVPLSLNGFTEAVASLK